MYSRIFDLLEMDSSLRIPYCAYLPHAFWRIFSAESGRWSESVSDMNPSGKYRLNASCILFVWKSLESGEAKTVSYVHFCKSSPMICIDLSALSSVSTDLLSIHISIFCFPTRILHCLSPVVRFGINIPWRISPESLSVWICCWKIRYILLASDGFSRPLVFAQEKIITLSTSNSCDSSFFSKIVSRITPIAVAMARRKLSPQWTTTTSSRERSFGRGSILWRCKF